MRKDNDYFHIISLEAEKNEYYCWLSSQKAIPAGAFIFSPQHVLQYAFTL